MEKHFGKEVRQSATHEQLWVKENMQIYVRIGNTYRELKHHEDENHDRIVKAEFFKKGWCYVEFIMEESWEEQHKKNIKRRAYNNMRKETTTGLVYGSGHVHIFNSETTCQKYRLTITELRDIVENSLKRIPTPKSKRKMKCMDDSVKDNVKRERESKARKKEMDDEQEVGLRLPNNYEPYDRVPSINLGIKPNKQDESNSEEE
jgi:hypothetical protein